MNTGARKVVPRDEYLPGYNAFGDLSISKSWKDVVIRLWGSDEFLVLPVMASTRVLQVKQLLCQRFMIENMNSFQFMVKKGGSYQKLKNCDEVGSQILVKGIATFARKKMKYPHPLVIIGCGSIGLRQGMECIKEGYKDFVQFDRKAHLGGHAWHGFANPTSKLQSEGPTYQLQYHKDYPSVEEMTGWPSRQTILTHMARICGEYGLTPHLRMKSDVKALKVEKGDTWPFISSYSLMIAPMESEAEEPYAEDTVFKCSGIMHYPGCLVKGVVVSFPGEDVFEGQLAYGFGNGFDYSNVRDKQVVLVGMGAFSTENTRTCCEYGAQKCWIISRKQNLLLPRFGCYWQNSSPTPVPGVSMLNCFAPMYAVAGWDPWDFYSVSSNATRSFAKITQSSRWGTGDFFFLAVHYGKAEVIVDEVKRLKPRSVVLSRSGITLDDIDHFCKVCGFKGDETVDELHQAKKYVGYWPNGDWQRWVFAESPQIDAANFGGTTLNPGVASQCWVNLYYYETPGLGVGMVNSGQLPTQEPGKINSFGVEVCGYQWEARLTAMIGIAIQSATQELNDFGAMMGTLKRKKMYELMPPNKWHDLVVEDWYHYCRLFKEQGDDRPFPPYPYTLEYVEACIEKLDKESAEQQERQSLQGFDAAGGMTLENPAVGTPAYTYLSKRAGGYGTHEQWLDEAHAQVKVLMNHAYGRKAADNL
eukprot:gnl/TRDRNA2_/TRDRNA2_35461_c0_seq1.p1 gnl/TRDRNA2_/TRDRNA2_35461_c0~~gnl/TRDRNA2_/TRDRNA2_35461_c0_seq1.p1  ORF type:complete len:700 (-),score=133.98 gnl/TRDRNA2_/TRDRNA2_35461_c0_seq1:100-2199(-)